MRKLANVGAFLAILSGPVTASGKVSATCLTDAEAQALFTFMMPEALSGVVKSCKENLPPTSYLVTRGDEAISRYQAAASGSWPGARAAFLKIAGEDDEDEIIAGMSDAALKPFVGEALSGFVAKDVKPADCPKIDRFVAALAPIAPDKVAELITALVVLVGGKEKDDLNLC